MVSELMTSAQEFNSSLPLNSSVAVPPGSSTSLEVTTELDVSKPHGLSMSFNINNVFRTPMEKLDYTNWKSQFESVLDLHELSHVVIDPPQEEKFPDGSENPTYLK